MKAGFLGIETPPENAHLTGLIRLVSWEELPISEDSQYPENVHYIAKFNDILAAELHFHNGLHNKLQDVDQHIYRADLADAIAVIEAEDDLRHERIWIDPTINHQELDKIKENIVKIRTRKEKTDRAIQLLGYAAIALLVLYGLSSIL